MADNIAKEIVEMVPIVVGGLLAILGGVIGHW
jgi:Mg2+/citrate symporter